MEIFLVIINVFLVIAALIMTVTVLLQSSDDNGLSALTGGSDKQYSRSKAKSIDAKLALVTKICAVTFVVLCIGSMLISRAV
ncbi:MAG: preprotein translocase subunit SecG [Clostridia bacterium]|jgi:preprotein translocase subunit SecG|nr:preprotein translocase subunit SecG [Clostridia bacterium]